MTLSDMLSLAGLVVGVIGFVITIAGVTRSKNAAQRAEAAAIKTQEAIIRSQTLTDFASAITMMNEIKRLHRVEAWQIVPERYAALRAILISIRVSNPSLSQDHISVLQGAIKHLSDFEAVVEKALISSTKTMPNPARLNAVVSSQIDKMDEILSTIKQDIRE